MSIVLAAGCDADQQESQPEQPANEAAAAPAPKSDQVAQDVPGKTSIIRPSVLAETEEPPEPPPEPVVIPVHITIPFADADGALPPDAAGLLDALLERPVVARGCIVIRGHTDSRGSDEQNVRASLRRAELVRDYLVERGVDAERIRLVALGERRPIAPNALPDGGDYPGGRAKNRRVDVEVRPPAGGGKRTCATGDIPALAQPE